MGSSRERDLVLAPNEFAFISDQTKGNINVYVGPYKTSLANTDQPVFFNKATKRFEDCTLEVSTRLFPTAPKGWYVTVKNPSRDGRPPKTGTVNNLTELEVGHKVNLPGPVSFALWPGQMARVLQGHQLRSNQYLLVRIYDEAAARSNWHEAVVERQTAADGEEDGTATEVDTEALTLGRRMVIRGTGVSFYIPPTGVEVLRGAHGAYVRDAVTLERLEYCVLLDEDGNKRYIQGPAVVFPEPTEAFVEEDGRRKFRAIELNENSGLYVKVIAPYTDGDTEHAVGDELFITGRDQMIYFPRPEHALIRYGDRQIHYAVAIPAGEGRYVLHRHTGQIRLVRGPRMFLPDPREEVIVRRVLEPSQVALWFPGNAEALDANRRLEAQGPDHSSPQSKASHRARRSRARVNSEGIERETAFTPPRTITLHTKYDGAVTVSVWTGYAVQVVRRTGEREVVVGPETRLLEYDESLEPITLSTGTPKSDAEPLRTVYLRALHNKVSDRVDVETADLVGVSLDLSYRVNFEGDPSRWFHVENYVKFLTDHLRSLLRNAVKKVGVQAFHAQAIELVRDTVLGRPGEDGQRPGRAFAENGMRVYDVEVLDVHVGDEHIADLLVGAQHAVVDEALTLAAEERRLQMVQRREAIRRQIAEAEQETRRLELTLDAARIEQEHAVNRTRMEGELARVRRELEARQQSQELLDAVHTAELSRTEKTQALEAAHEAQALARRVQELDAEVQAVVHKAEAVSPELVAALQAFSDRALVEKVSASMAPLAILGGDSVADVLSRLLAGTPLASMLSETSVLSETSEGGVQADA